MKFVITINQQQFLNIQPDITFQDAIVLDCIYGLCTSVSEKIEGKRVQKDGKSFTWISYALLLDELPMLKGSTPSSLVPVIKRLEDWKFVDSFLENGTNKKYFRPTQKLEDLFRNQNRYEAEPISKSKQPYFEIKTYQVTKDKETITKVTPAEFSGKEEQQKPEKLPPEMPKAKFSLSSVDRNIQERKAPSLQPEYNEVLQTFRLGAFKNCNERTTSIREGIPQAVKIFEGYYPGSGKQKLIEALKKLFPSSYYQWSLDKAPERISPKVIFSKKFVEEKLLVLLTEKEAYAGTDGGMVQHPKTEDELRKAQEVGQRGFTKLMERINAGKNDPSGV